jgi:uncharacterized protein YjbJ (UPF0337 family)
MNKDQVKGRVEEAKGNLKESTGKAVGNPDLEAEGTLDKAAARCRRTTATPRKRVKDAIDKI